MWLLFLLLLTSNVYAWPQGAATSIVGADTLPVDCSDRDVFVDTNATSGQRIYLCETNTWVQQGGAGGGSGTVSSGTADRVAIYDTAGTTVVSSSVITDNNTNIGIGSTTPTQKLDVNGVVKATTFSGAGTSLTGTAASLTAGSVTTNANLTGVITSVGNATSIASQTGTGSQFVVASSPTITTPVITSINPGADFSITNNSVAAFKSLNSGATVNTLVLSAGNVGVGSLSPGKALDVNGTVRAIAFIGDGSGLTGVSTISGLTTNYVTKASSATAIANSQIFDNGTNVGLGSAVPGQKLDVAGTIRSTGLEGTTVAQMNVAGNQGIAFDPVNATYTTPKLILNTSGNIGINTTTSPNTFYVGGTAEVQGFKLPGNGVAAGYVLTAGSTGIGTWMPAASGSGVSGITTNYIPKAASSTSLNDSALYQSGSNIGIGSTNPGQVLDVNGTIRSSGTIIATGTGNTLLAQTSGNVGINSATPGERLDVTGTVRATSFKGDGSQLTGIGGSISGLTTGKLTKAASSTTIADSVIVELSGNIGIGSSAPGKTLDVTGTIRASTYFGDGSNLTGIGAGSNYWSLTAAAGNVGISTTNTVGIGTTMGSAGLTVMNGNVGIGTWNPLTKLEVIGNGSLSTYSHNGVSMFYNGASQTLNSGAASVANFASSGSTTDVITWGGTYVNSGSLVGQLGFSGGSNDIQVSVKNGNLQFQVDSAAANTERMRIVGASGNVGIGTVTPGQKLDVTGTIRASSGISSVGIGTTVPQQLCRKSNGDFGYFNGAWASVCN